MGTAPTLLWSKWALIGNWRGREEGRVFMLCFLKEITPMSQNMITRMSELMVVFWFLFDVCFVWGFVVVFSNSRNKLKPV